MARKRGIDRNDVADAVVGIAEEAGLDGVTLAAVASRLGIRSPSLYAHVEGLAGLRRLLALRAAERMATSFKKAVGGRRGVPALRALAVEYRRYAAAHPALYAAAQVAVTEEKDPELYGMLATAAQPAIHALGEAGLPESERVHITRAIRSALHGFVLLEQGGGFGMPESIDESFRRLVDMLLASVTMLADGTRYGPSAGGR
jgi:AcrR family transcriptional regulator